MYAPPVVASARAPMESCRTMPSQELRVHLIDQTGAEPATLEVAVAETSEIWAPAGLRFKWTSAPTLPPPPDGRTVIVVIRRDLRPMWPAGAASARGRKRTPLGWLSFDEQGRSGHLIEVSFAATAALVHRGSQIDLLITALPEFRKSHLLGRGLGRVIAHEIGHWLMGRGHVEAGLMKARFGAQDLVEFRSPHLPKAWLAASADPRASSASACTPLALHRLLAE
jgi:hypothetical protein